MSTAADEAVAKLQLKTLRAKRGGHKGYSTTLIKESEGLIAASNGKADDELETIKEELETNLQLLQERIEKIKVMDEQILDLVDAADIDKEMTDAGVFERSVKKITVAITRWQRKNADSMPSNSSGSNACVNQHCKSSEPQLPKLKLEPYSGDPLLWKSFWDSYDAAVHKNERYAPVAKFNYLKGLLKGKARTAIEGLSVTSNNYDNAVAILEERFGDDQMIIQAHMDALFAIKPIQSESASELRDMCDIIEIHTRNLQQFEICPNTYGPMLNSLIMNNLPPEFKKDVRRQLPPGKVDIEHLMKVFKQEVRTRECCETQDRHENNDLPGGGTTMHVGNRGRGDYFRSRGRNGKGRGGGGNKYTPSCTYCKGSHPSNKCTEVTDVESRKSIVRDKNKCFVCLRNGHEARFCYSDRKCPNCNGKHHISLCTKDVVKDENRETVEKKDGEVSNVQTTVISNNKNVLLQTAIAFAFNNQLSAKLRVRVLFDNCAQRSFIRADLRDKLKLTRTGTEKLGMNVFASTKENVQNLDVVRVTLTNRRNSIKTSIDACVVPTICSKLCGQTIDVAKEIHDELYDLELADNNNVSTDLDIDILIGANYYWDFVTGKIKRCDNGLVAVHSTLDWLLNGTVMEETESRSSQNMVVKTHVMRVGVDVGVDDNESFEEDCDTYLGTKQNEVSEEFDSNKFIEDIKFNGERYSVPLPWKREDGECMSSRLPVNYAQSKSRLLSLLRRLKDNPDDLKGYDDIIQQQLADGIIEKCDPSVPHKDAYYFPHHGVVKTDRETTKRRIVFDGSSNNPSLNDCMEKGPCLLQLLLDVILRFRAQKVAMTSDIKQAFLNVAVEEEFRDFLRFLWVEDIHAEKFKLATLRFTRVLFGMNASLYLLAAAILKHFENYEGSEAELIQHIIRCLYVDDYSGGDDDVEKAVENFYKIDDIFAAGGWTLHKWCSNIAELQEHFKSRGKESKAGNVTKVLGCGWDVEQDVLFADISDIHTKGTEIKFTKRNLFKISMSIFDPIGHLSPLTVLLKMFIQSINKLKCSWDKQLAPEMKKDWLKLMDFFNINGHFKFPRYYFGSHRIKDVRNIQLHGFCDASKAAVAAVIYIVSTSTNNESTQRLVLCKTNVTPILKPGESLSMPRLELRACVLLAEWMAHVRESTREEFKIDKEVCWSDSLDTIYWIKNEERKRGVFIQNRVVKIRKLTNTWRHCPGEINPADLPSRGISNKKDIHEKLKIFINGPDFTFSGESSWPDDKSEIENEDEFLVKRQEGRIETPDVEKMHVNLIEVDVSKSAPRVVSKANVLHVSNNVGGSFQMRHPVNQILHLDKIMNIEHFNDLQKLLRVSAYVVRYIHNSKRALTGDELKSGYLTMEEYENAELCWVKVHQKELVVNSKQLNNTIGLRVQGDLIVCKGRMKYSSLPENQIHPVLISGDSHFARLLTIHAHLNANHGDKRDTLIELRSKYYVTKAKRLVHYVIRACVNCNKLEGKPFKSVESAPLPDFRVEISFPFANTGVDYLGPLLVRQVFDSNDVKMYKVEVVVYTCAVTRAVSLDLVPDLGASAFIRSLKRFIGRRGTPNLMISDNATCFKNEELKLSEELLEMGIRWKYIIEASPWWGGFWERMVQAVKRSMRKILWRSSVNYEELLTILAEIEGIINSRPLTYVFDDQVEDVLTPAHLLLGRRTKSRNMEAMPEKDEAEVTKVKLTKRMKYLKTISEHYWKRFSNEYLMELRSKHKMGKDPSRTPELGEIVIVHGKEKRNQWRLGKIVSFVTGKDQRIRAVVLRVFDGSITRYIKRPIEKLYPIEVKSKCAVTEEEIEKAKSAVNEVESDNTHEPRERRKAAENGEMIRRLLGQE